MLVNKSARIEQRDILDVCAIIMRRKRFRWHTCHKQVNYECHEQWQARLDGIIFIRFLDSWFTTVKASWLNLNQKKIVKTAYFVLKTPFFIYQHEATMKINIVR